MSDDSDIVSRRAFLRTAAGGAALAGASGAAAAQEGGNGTSTGGNQTTASGNQTAGNQSAGGNQSSGGNQSGSGSGGGGGGTATVEVGAGPSGLKFTPGTDEALTIKPGTTVTFKWVSDGHNIVVESQPEGASWKGHEPIENTGFSLEHTFDTKGTYEYFCQPHKSAGMVGTIEVTDETSSGGGGGGGARLPTVPGSAKSLGVATSFMMAATLGLAYFFIKFGGDYGTDE
jgi:plastocyanin